MAEAAIRISIAHLGDQALGLLFPGLLEQSRPCRKLKHLADALVGLGRALEVLGGLDVAGNRLSLWSISIVPRFLLQAVAYLFRGHGLLAGLAELLDRLLVEAQILLATNKDLGDIRAEMVYF